jgi:aryl-phospho-beta-D-glucosidase BglC (GH1 family)
VSTPIHPPHELALTYLLCSLHILPAPPLQKKKNELSSLPIGYWHVPTNASVVPYVPGGWPYIKRALGWARQHNIHVILDVHGAPGSQNGFDNSGQHTNTPQWALNQANIDATLEVIKVIATEVGSQVDAIELLNEIAGFLGPQWNAAARTFYQSGYDVVRQAAGDNVVVVIGDTFDALSVRACHCITPVVRFSSPVQSWQGLLDYPQANRAMMDVVSLTSFGSVHPFFNM